VGSDYLASANVIFRTDAGPTEKGVAALEVSVDNDTCIGAGECTLRCPEVFGLDDGYVVLLNPAPADPLHRQVEAAVAGCPSGAIAVTG
jgi:ferredoxin